MTAGGPEALQASGVTRLLLAAAAAGPPAYRPPPPQPSKGTAVTGSWPTGDGYAAALSASRASASARAASASAATFAAAAAGGGAAGGAGAVGASSLVRLTAGRTLEDFETRETIFVTLLQCSTLIAQEAEEARHARVHVYAWRTHISAHLCIACATVDARAAPPMATCMCTCACTCTCDM